MNNPLLDISAPAAGAVFSSFSDRITVAQNELEAIDKCLGDIRKAHEKRKNKVVKAEEEALTTASIKENINTILHKARSIQYLLHDLNSDHSAPEELRNLVGIGIRNSLKNRLTCLNNLRQNIRDDFREEVVRYYYIVCGQNPEAEIVDQMIECGQSQNFLHQAIMTNHGQDNVVNSILVADVEEKYKDIKGIESDLQELQQMFMDLSMLVVDQGQDLDEIEKNIKESGGAVMEGVGLLNAAYEENKSSRRIWIWFWVVLILLVMVVVVSVVVIVAIHNSTQKSYHI